MKRILLLLGLIFTTATVSAQFVGQRQNQFNRQRQPPQPPTENEKERAAKKVAERKKELVTNFLSTLEIDEFVKEIATQTFDDYFNKIEAFMKIPYDNAVERKDAFDVFRHEHFKELKSLLSEGDSKKLDDFLEGKFEEKEVKKKRRKNRKKKNDN
ncbi:MAG: hypothetical protein ED556_08500 [Winogradskyella sp.]|uniref:hypothetical protein n=1 Tax=Winogradskyella sp. TaxID=1883156 RepID=UPI000F3D4202|nr:hypothetical protein [Winogradskyella sp.]RNC86324.1 MAG: hypothetical protein ED556_08500 [Winogradskyella sp.]